MTAEVNNPYDEFPYRSYPVEWSAPERLALTSLLHGGPRFALDRPYNVLEIGCGDGSNLLPLAYYRPYAHFTGIDTASTQIEAARSAQSKLGLANLDFLTCDVRYASEVLASNYEIIIAHGVFSWIPRDARDALLALCSSRLRPGGLLYLNYNAKPGWNVRGLVRDFLLSQTSEHHGLAQRTAAARALSTRMADALAGAEHPYSALLCNEFRFVNQSPPSHTAHEYLSADNRAYARADFLALVRANGLSYVADADYTQPSGRVSPHFSKLLSTLEVSNDTNSVVDLLSYRQLHSPILTLGAHRYEPVRPSEIVTLSAASQLEHWKVEGNAHLFRDAAGTEVRVTTEPFATALKALRARWPEFVPVGEVFSDGADVVEDVILLNRQGLLALRPANAARLARDSAELHAVECQRGYVTSSDHVAARWP